MVSRKSSIVACAPQMGLHGLEFPRRYVLLLALAEMQEERSVLFAVSARAASGVPNKRLDETAPHTVAKNELFKRSLSMRLNNVSRD